jgi:hypothetical protein
MGAAVSTAESEHLVELDVRLAREWLRWRKSPGSAHPRAGWRQPDGMPVVSLPRFSEERSLARAIFDAAVEAHGWAGEVDERTGAGTGPRWAAMIAASTGVVTKVGDTEAEACCHALVAAVPHRDAFLAREEREADEYANLDRNGA